MRTFKQYFAGFWLILAYIIEWTVEMILRVWSAFHLSVKEGTKALETIYNELKQKPGEPDSGKV
jgi:hypothetical protein